MLLDIRKVMKLVTVRDVPPDIFIKNLAKYLKERVGSIKPPEWALYVKTGCHVERIPEDLDWWYYRSASILRKIYLHGPMGVERLRKKYGGRVDLGMQRKHVKKGGGAIIRNILKQLEESGLVTKDGNRGRVLTPQGRSLLDRIAMYTFKSIIRIQPKLKKYA